MNRGSSGQAPPWRADRLALRLPHLRARAAIKARLAAWFTAQGFLEVETPALQVAPGGEAHIQAFATEWKSPDGASVPRYLRFSPEFAMKKLMAGGIARQFQFATVWRNGEASATHHPEFTMLEWYRAQADYSALMEDCEALLRAAAACLGKTELNWNGTINRLDAPFERLTVAAAFKRYASIDLAAATGSDPLHPALAALAAAARPLGIAAHDGDRWEDLFFRILFEKIEPHLGRERPTFLTEYPISMAALARPKPGDAAVAERFELYACGLELANAYGELTDPAEQRRRLEADRALKQRLYDADLPIDEDFLSALQAGLPPSSGIALGFDRLIMLCTGAARIEDVLWLPVA